MERTLETRTAAPVGSRDGGKTKVKATNLRKREYLSRRLDAISLSLAPPFADEEAIAAALIALADDVLLGGAL